MFVDYDYLCRSVKTKCSIVKKTKKKIETFLNKKSWRNVETQFSQPTTI